MKNEEHVRIALEISEEDHTAINEIRRTIQLIEIKKRQIKKDERELKKYEKELNALKKGKYIIIKNSISYPKFIVKYI